MPIGSIEYIANFFKIHLSEKVSQISLAFLIGNDY